MEGVGRPRDRVDVVGFGRGGRTLHGREADGTDLGQDPEQGGERAGAEPGFAAVLVPVVRLGDGGNITLEALEVGVGGVIGRVREHGLAMQQGDGVGDAGDKRAGGEAIALDVDAAAASGGEVFAQPVGLVESEGKLARGHLKTDVAQVVDGREAVMSDLVDVEGELGLDVLVLALGITDGVAVFHAELGELDGDGAVGGLRMPDGVADVVRQGADGEGELVGVAGVAEEVDHKVAGPHVVSEVGEEPVAEGVVTDVLDDAAAVSVRTRVLELRGREGGITAEQKGNDGALPGEVDQLLMGEQGVGRGASRAEQREQKQGKKKQGAGGSSVAHGSDHSIAAWMFGAHSCFRVRTAHVCLLVLACEVVEFVSADESGARR